MPPTTPPKPHLKYDELIARLKSRGMIIPDEDRAKRKLSQIGYYRLSGFWYPCRRGKLDEKGRYLKDSKSNLPIRDDQFQEGVNFNLITDLYIFDKKLRQLLLDAIERIEIHVRSVIAHELGRFDPMAYLNASFINPKILAGTHWCNWRIRQEQLIKDSKEDCILWHKKNNRSIPFWVAVETWDFGLMSKYFENLKGHYQNMVCKRLEVLDHSEKPHVKSLKNWLQEINILRNRCAHHSRIWNKSSGNAITIPPNAYFNECNLDQHAKTRIYSKICILWFLVKKIGPHSQWIRDIADLVDSKPDLECLPYTAMGLPNNTGFPRKKFHL